MIVICSKSSHFWPYLNISEGMKLFERTLPITTAMINENLRHGSLQADYKYGIRGYVRLTKKSDLPHKITLEYFHANKAVDPKKISAGKKYTSCIWVEPPFCKYILGVYQFIEVTNLIEPTLFFLADEIHAFEKTDDFTKLFTEKMFNNILKSSTELNVGHHNLEHDELKEIIVDHIDNTEKNIEMVTSGVLIDQIVVDEIKHVEKKQNRFFKNGNCFEIFFDTQKLVLKASKGLSYIEFLIKKIRQEIHVNELERIVNKQLLPEQNVSLNEIESNHLNDANTHLQDTIADKRAINEVNTALAEIKEELELAKEADDVDEIERLEEMLEKYNQYLSGATGKYYKPRKVPDNDEKARKRVFAAVKDALKIIKASHEMLFQHLSQSIHTGEFCIYKPPTQIDWVDC